jgi:hypothetical protein
MNRTPVDIFRDPPKEYGIMPFWFWNDDLDEREIVRQIGEFHAKGFGGFIPHARIGLSRRVGYLTDEWFRLVRIATEEAARLGMKVVLYDEGSYPSGSACGQVVRERPDLATRCLIAMDTSVEGPVRGYWRPNPGRSQVDRLVCVVQARELADGSLDPSTMRLLDVGSHDVVRYDIAEDGTWRLIAVWDVMSGSRIRGVHDEEDDGHPLSPPLMDILNPEAAQVFLQTTHDKYYEHLSEYFGTTVIAMFTDEPHALGRSTSRGPNPKAYTPGFIDWIADRWDEDVCRWLPSLWHDCGSRTEDFRRMYDRAVLDRMEEVFYATQSDWCADHGICLTGHPAQSNEMSSLRWFQWPGQDMVWRYVEPNCDKALEGDHSVASKAATSAAVTGGRTRISMETFGAYGWHLTLDEAKWLLDWHLVRGNNLMFAHAAFYSIRGRRAFESEPDIGLHNVWWPYFGMLGDYVRRASWILSEGEYVCDVGILTDGNHMSWEAASVLQRSHIDFLYVDGDGLARATVEDGLLKVGNAAFRVLVVDGYDEGNDTETLREFQETGGLLVSDWTTDSLVTTVSQSCAADVTVLGNGIENLRVLHYRKSDLDIYFVVNEGEVAIDAELNLQAIGSIEKWDPMTGSAEPWSGVACDGKLHTTIRVERRESAVFVVNPAQAPSVATAARDLPGTPVLSLDASWKVTRADGDEVDIPCPGDWARNPGWETFTGTLTYQIVFDLDGPPDGSLFLDLGSVGDIAEVELNGRTVGVRAWAPYVFDVTQAVRASDNHLSVRVTNSMANEYDGRQMPSGILGPVKIRMARDV